MKTLEQLILRLLKLEPKDNLDPLQFAYRQHNGVNDAVLYMLHHALSRLEEPGAYVKIMFYPTYSKTSSQRWESLTVHDHR